MVTRNRRSNTKQSVAKAQKATPSKRLIKIKRFAPDPNYKGPYRMLFVYPGAKWMLMSKYLPLFPEHTTYVSLFGGAAADIARKPPSKVELYNDFDGDVYNVFQVLKNNKHRKKLVELVENTPYGRKQFNECYAILRSSIADPVTKAWAFLIVSCLGYRGVYPGLSYYWAGRSPKNVNGDLNKLPQSIEEWKERFLKVRLECDDWEKVLKRYDSPDTFFFADPPYRLSLIDRKLYRCDMTDEQHIKLLQALNKVQGKVMLCGYDSPLYAQYLKGWKRIEFPTTAMMSKKKPKRVESLWLNYDISDEQLAEASKPKAPQPKPKAPKQSQPMSEAAKSLPTTIPLPKGRSKNYVLSEIDKELLEGIEQRRKTLATMIRGVKDGDTTAFFLYGPGGHGKSKLIRDAFKGHKKIKIWNSDMSPRALVGKLEEFPNYIHFFEDLEKIYKDHDCQGILIAACGGKKHHKRIVQWHKHKIDIDFEFTGGIIITSNDRLDPRPGRLGAVASRFSPQEWKLSDPELAALMRHIALTEYQEHRLSKSEACEVADFVIAEMEQRSGQGKVDLRTLVEQSIPDFKQWKGGRSEVHWHELVRARINGAPSSENRKARNERLQYVACEVHFAVKGLRSRLNLWKSRTLGEGQDGDGLGKQAFYDRLKEAKENGLFAQMQKTHKEDAA